MPPFETLERLGFTKGTNMADIGCGIGYFSVPAADIGGESSKIYAMDISLEMLEEVEKRALEVGMSNIRTVKVDEYDLKLENQSVGFALLSNVLHEVDDKERYITEIHRILSSDGIFAIIEWEKINGESGPPFEHRISFEEVTQLLTKSGYESIVKHNIGHDFYGITAVKK
jgi:ubiquinone/menaquinone biosynthesis C-methylase UbiE